MKLLSAAFRATLDKFGIKGQQLAVDTGVAEGSISHFRNGQGIRTDSLEKIIEAFSDEALTYWLSQIAHGKKLNEFGQNPISVTAFSNEFIQNPQALTAFVETLDTDSTAKLLTALAAKIRSGTLQAAKAQPVVAK